MPVDQSVRSSERSVAGEGVSDFLVEGTCPCGLAERPEHGGIEPCAGDRQQFLHQCSSRRRCPTLSGVHRGRRSRRCWARRSVRRDRMRRRAPRVHRRGERWVELVGGRSSSASRFDGSRRRRSGTRGRRFRRRRQARTRRARRRSCRHPKRPQVRTPIWARVITKASQRDFKSRPGLSSSGVQRDELSNAVIPLPAVGDDSAPQSLMDNRYPGKGNGRVLVSDPTPDRGMSAVVEPIASLTGAALVGGRRLSELVAYYEENPVEVKGQVEIPGANSSDGGSRSEEGVIRPSLVYVRVPRAAGPVLVPFGEYDDWCSATDTTRRSRS